MEVLNILLNKVRLMTNNEKATIKAIESNVEGVVLKRYQLNNGAPMRKIELEYYMRGLIAGLQHSNSTRKLKREDIINGIRSYYTYTLEDMEPYRNSLRIYFDRFFGETPYLIEVENGLYAILPIEYGDTKEELVRNFCLTEEEAEKAIENSIRL